MKYLAPLTKTADNLRPKAINMAPGDPPGDPRGFQHVSNVSTICKCGLDLLLDLVTLSSTQSSFTLKNDFFS